ncbi:MAG: CotH kinase family protein, partial [Eubacteriales bacterium]|nr:CotH kinase family protein [Eubacteriales bacterium]
DTGERNNESGTSGSETAETETSGSETAGSEKEEPVPNFTRRGDDWEREADFSLWRDSRQIVSQPAGIRIQGNYAREYAKKRFSIFAREKYSRSRWFDAPIVEGKKTHSLMTRDSFLNAFSLNLTQGRAAAAQTAEPVIVFLNGELWEDNYYLLEKYSAAWFAEEYGLNQDTIRMIKTTFWSSVPEEDRQIYEEILHFARTHDLSGEADYAALGRLVDLQSYIDYWCMNLYLDNEDAGETVNVCLWRVDRAQNEDEGDGRWRWAMQDLDLTWGRRDRKHHGEQPWEVNTFALADSRSPGDDCRAFHEQPLYNALRENPGFRRQFVLTFMDLVNTTFRKETVLEKLVQTESAKDIYKSFFENRPDYIVPALAEEFGLTGTPETIAVRTEDPAAGTVTLGTITPDLSGGEWTGQYFTDFPVTLTAEPAAGYVFSGWLVNGKPVTDRVLELSFGKGGAEIRPVFEKKE